MAQPEVCFHNQGTIDQQVYERRTMKERVVFEVNVPVTATLAYPDGLKVHGRFGDQVMYSLTDE